MEGFGEKDRYDRLEDKLASALETVESIVAEKLDNYGIYYRMFSRVKKGESIRKKLSQDRYINNPDKKLQDILGVRVVLYYEDDIEVCKKIFANILEQHDIKERRKCAGDDKWEQYESNEDTFTATKINGVFDLPGFIKRIVEPEIQGLRIEPTFEIQLRTMFFEGWHEVEHDLRYKNAEQWDDFPKESRKLNSVLATLEMCDQYMLTLFDDIGHVFYKQQNWGEMLRYKYRLKTLNGEMDEELEKLITIDLAKKMFKWQKQEFIDMVLERNFSILDANVIVYLVNESLKGMPAYCPEIAERFDVLYQEQKQKTRVWTPKEITKLRQEKAFDVTVTLGMGEKTKEQVVTEVCECVYYEWLADKIGKAMKEEMDRSMHPLHIMDNGIIIQFDYDIEKHSMAATLSHAALEETAKIWNVDVELFESGGELILHCMNTRFNAHSAARTIMPFSKPGVYTDLARKIGIYDCKKLRSKVTVLKEEDLQEFYELVENPKRKLPVVLISYPDEEERFKKNSCYGRLVDYAANPKMSDQTHLMRKIAYLCHVYCVTGQPAKQIADELQEDENAFSNGVRFFGKGFLLEKKENYQSFDEEKILNHPKDTYALHSKPPYCYMSVSGADATRHEVIQMVYRDILR